MALFSPIHSGHAEQRPYTELESRQIKALSGQEVMGYLAGHGMGYALAAELNGYPGPKHVLELSDELGLSPSQHRRVSEIFDSMQSAAAALGEKIVATERALDAAFAGDTISRASLEETVVDIAGLEGRLRAAHLAAHLETRALLDPRQVHRYGTLRGYQGMDDSRMEPHQHH